MTERDTAASAPPAGVGTQESCGTPAISTKGKFASGNLVVFLRRHDHYNKGVVRAPINILMRELDITAFTAHELVKRLREEGKLHRVAPDLDVWSFTPVGTNATARTGGNGAAEEPAPPTSRSATEAGSASYDGSAGRPSGHPLHPLLPPPEVLERKECHGVLLTDLYEFLASHATPDGAVRDVMTLLTHAGPISAKLNKIERRSKAIIALHRLECLTYVGKGLQLVRLLHPKPEAEEEDTPEDEPAREPEADESEDATAEEPEENSEDANASDPEPSAHSDRADQRPMNGPARHLSLSLQRLEDERIQGVSLLSIFELLCKEAHPMKTTGRKRLHDPMGVIRQHHDMVMADTMHILERLWVSGRLEIIMGNYEVVELLGSLDEQSPEAGSAGRPSAASAGRMRREDLESKIIELLLSGARNSEIAEQLGYSKVYINIRLSTLYKQHGVANRAQLAAKLRTSVPTENAPERAATREEPPRAAIPSTAVQEPVAPVNDAQEVARREDGETDATSRKPDEVERLQQSIDLLARKLYELHKLVEQRLPIKDEEPEWAGALRQSLMSQEAQVHLIAKQLGMLSADTRTPEERAAVGFSKPDSAVRTTARTEMERRVLTGLAQGKRNAEIARECGIGQPGVGGQVKKLLQRTGAASREELVTFAQKELGITPDPLPPPASAERQSTRPRAARKQAEAPAARKTRSARAADEDEWLDLDGLDALEKAAGREITPKQYDRIKRKKIRGETRYSRRDTRRALGLKP